jgi:hypothetical protein
LLGVFEAGNLEFKRAPWGLDTDRGKAELAKDLAGMSNAGGGLIVLGIETSPDASLGRDKSTGLRPLSPGSCDASRIQDVARTWIVPPLRDLRILEWPNAAGDAMLVSLEVPGPIQMGGLALVLGPGEPPDRKTIGVPVRSDAGIDWHTAPEIHDWIRAGRLIGQAGVAITSSTPEGGKLSAVEAPRPPEATSRAIRTEADAQFGRLRIEFIDVAAEGRALFVLQSWPTIPVRIRGIFDRDGPRSFFSNPPPHRDMGFNWWGYLQPEVDTQTRGLRASSGRTTWWLTPAAVMTLVVDQEYLTWASDRLGLGLGGLLINPYAVGEYTFEFCRTMALIAPTCTPRPAEACFRVGILQALHPSTLHLGTGPPRTFFPRQAKPAPADELIDVTEPIDISHPDRAPFATVEVLRHIYGLFGLGRESIPFLEEDGSRFNPSLLNVRP